MIFFFPDEHLGPQHGLPPRHGARRAAGAGPRARRSSAGWSRPTLGAASQVILWKGFCNVHTAFTVRQIDEARAADPDVRVIVHPECPRPVVEAADEDGSTEYIIRRCEELPGGASAVIGTDWNLVEPPAAAAPGESGSPASRRTSARA